MRYWGTLMGSSFGFMMGGPLGAMMGAALGRNFDLGSNRAGRSKAGRKTGDQDEIYNAFLTATFQVMGYLAKADGRVSENAIATAQAAMIHLALNPERTQAMIRCFDQGKQPAFVLDAALKEFRRHCLGRSDLIRKFMEIQFCILYADGVPDAEARDRLLAIARTVGFSRLLFEMMDILMRSRHPPRPGARPEQRHGSGRRPPVKGTSSLGAAYAVLGLDRGASNQEIKQAYRRLINRHHPDKLAARGLPETALAQATEKTREIRTAYDRLKAARGL